MKKGQVLKRLGNSAQFIHNNLSGGTVIVKKSELVSFILVWWEMRKASVMTKKMTAEPKGFYLSYLLYFHEFGNLEENIRL